MYDNIRERKKRRLPVKDELVKYLREFHAFEVSYTPPPQCFCSDKYGKTVTGSVALSQRVKRGERGEWKDDNFTPGGTRKCCKNGEIITVKTLPKFLSEDKGITGSKPGSYIDVPSKGAFNLKRTFLVKAICVCPCEDDKELEEKQFSWKATEGIIDIDLNP